MPDWFENFFAGEALELWRRAVPIETTEKELAFLQEVLDAPDEGRLLDVPCGNGRLSLPLSLCGYKVTGLDFCEEFLTEANASAKRHETKIDYIKGDMRQLTFAYDFDGAFCMGNSFGYFDRAGSQEFIKAISTKLNVGAKFVIDSQMIAECFLVNGAEREWMRVGDMHMLFENRYDCRRSCVETTYTFIRNGKEEQRLAVHWIYTAGELCYMLEQEGFTVLEMLSSTDFDPFTLGSERLILLAQKS